MRTQFNTVIQSTTTGKWAAAFETINGQPGEEYIANTCTSAFVFDTQDEAYAGATRALDHLEQHGMWPNMCERF